MEIVKSYRRVVYEKLLNLKCIKSLIIEVKDNGSFDLKLNGRIVVKVETEIMITVTFYFPSDEELAQKVAQEIGATRIIFDVPTC